MKKLLLIITVILTSVSAVWAEDYSQGYYTMSPGTGNTYFGFYSSSNADSKYGGTEIKTSAVIFTFEKTNLDNVYYWYDCNNHKYIYADDSGYLKVSDGKNTNDNNYKWFIKDDGTGNLTITDMTNYNSGNPTMGLIQLNSVGGWWASKCDLSYNSGRNTWKLNLLMKKNTPYFISFKREWRKTIFSAWQTTYRYLQYESSTKKMKQNETDNKDVSYVWYINDVDYGEINLFTAKDAVNAMGYASNASAGEDKISTSNPTKSFYLRITDNSDYPIAFLSNAGNNTLYISNHGGKDHPYMGLLETLEDDGTRFKIEEADKYDVVITKPQSLTETPTVTCNLTGYSGQVVQNGGSIYIGKGNTLSTNNLTIPNYPYYKYTVSINDYVITVAYDYNPNREGITVPEGCNGYIGGITDISETEWKTQEYWSLSDNWNNYGPGCSVSGSAQGMWNPIYLQGITGGTVPALDGWNFRMVADNSKYTIESVGKIQYGDGVKSYITLKNTSDVTMNFGTGQANPFIVNLDEGTGNNLTFAMSNGFNSTITVNYGTVSKDMNRKFNASGTGTISTLNLNATIEGTIESDELTRHKVVLGRINSTPTDNITAANFTRTTGVLEATNDNIGKYSVVKDSNGDVTLYWVTGPLLTVLTNAYAGARNINDGILTVNSNSSTISKNSNGDIVLNNETGFNTTGNTSPLTTISFRITLDTPTSFTKIFTYSVTNDWTTEDGKVGIGINSSRQLEGLWNGSEWNTLTTGALDAGEHIITVTIGESDNGYGTRVYIDGGSTFYSASGLKTSNKTYKYILINHDIADKINALYVYNRALVSTEVKNVVSAIQKLPTPTTFPNNAKLYIIKDHNNNNLNVYYNGTNDYVRISNTSGNNDNYKWAIYTVNDKTYLYNLGANKFVCQIPGTGGHYSWPLKGNVANEMVITKNESNDNFNYYTFRSKYCTGDKDYLHYNSDYTYGSTNWGNGSDDSKWRITEVGVLTQEQQQAIEQAIVNNQRIPVAGKYYYIANDNDTKLQASDESGTLTFAATADRVKSKYVWKANVTAEGKFTFQNLATGKYLKHKGLQDSPYNFELENGFVPGQYSLYSEASSPYFVIKNDGTLDQASGTYNKTTTDYSTDYIFEEIAVSTSETSTAKHPVLEGVIVSPDVVVSTIDEKASILDLKNTTIIGTNIEEIKAAVVELTGNENAIIIAPEGTSVASTTTNVLLTTDTENTYTCNNLQLNDDVIAQFTGETPTTFTKTDVTYTRPTSSQWGTICLPYATSTGGEYSYYRLVDTKTGNLRFEKVTEETTIANEPYLIKKEDGNQFAISSENKEFSIGVAGDVDEIRRENSDFILQGVMINTSVVDGVKETQAKDASYTSVTDPNAYYFIAADNTFRKMNGRFNLKAFRAYLSRKKVNDADARTNIAIEIIHNDEPTGISFIESEDGNTVDVIFDLNGRRLQNTKKGINIINGKKVIK